VATVTNDVDDIRRQMALIRMHLHHDVRGVVAGAEAASDWRHYVRHYPWTILAAATAVGFLVVPRRRRSVRATAEAAATAAAEKVKESLETPPKAGSAAQARSGILGAALGFLGPLALRVAQSYAAHYIENLLAPQDDRQAGTTRGSAPSDSSSSHSWR
jgi:hypothetical protein